MFRQSIRSSKSLVLSFALSAFAAVGVTGCGESGTEGEEPVVQSDVQNIRVTANEIEKLAAGQFYMADLSRSKVVYRFDYSDKPIDFSRVQIAVGADATYPMEAQMEAVQQGDYGANPQPNLLAASDKRFSIAADPADFGVLTQSQLDEVKATGYFYDEAARQVTQSQPQSTDNCIHAVCVICWDLATGGPPSWLPGTYTCVEEQHTWCD